MTMKMRSRNYKSLLIISIIFLSFAASFQPIDVDSQEAFFTLVFKTNSGGLRPDYGNLLKQHLARIGINVEVIIQN